MRIQTTPSITPNRMSRPTSGSRNCPDMSRLHEMMVCGHRRLTHGSSARYNIQVSPETKSAVLMARMNTPRVSILNQMPAAQPQQYLERKHYRRQAKRTLAIAAPLPVISPRQKNGPQQE